MEVSSEINKAGNCSNKSVSEGPVANSNNSSVQVKDSELKANNAVDDLSLGRDDPFKEIRDIGNRVAELAKSINGINCKVNSLCNDVSTVRKNVGDLGYRLSSLRDAHNGLQYEFNDLKKDYAFVRLMAL